MTDLSSEILLAAVRAWVDIESPTNDAAGVNRVADHAESLLRGLGATIERTPGRDGFGDILIGRIAGDEPGLGLLLLGHMDTVHQHGTFQFRRDGGRAYGPGIYDMKGGNAIALAALQHIVGNGRRPRWPTLAGLS